jgi:hypothetical protein
LGKNSNGHTVTEDIRQKLGASHAVQSLRMESRISQAFADGGWEVDRSAYYTDLDTEKIREVDVYASRTFEKPIKRKGIGGELSG